ncbi:ATP7B (predicted) [Pycnogonum litorale]
MQQKTAKFLVTGMTSDSCVQVVEDAVTILDGIVDVQIMLSQRIAKITFSADVVDIDDILDTIDEAGFYTDVIDDGESEIGTDDVNVLDEFDAILPSDVSSSPTIQLDSLDVQDQPVNRRNDGKKNEIERILYKVDSIHCASCTRTIEDTISKLPGVITCDVSVMTGEAQVEYKTDKANPQFIWSIISKMGFTCQILKNNEGQPNDAHSCSVDINVKGMTSSVCVEKVRTSLLMINGIEHVTPSLSNQSVRVQYDPLETGPRIIIRQIKDAGFETGLRNGSSNSFLALSDENLAKWKLMFLFCLFLSLPTLGVKICFYVLRMTSKRFFDCCLIPGLSFENLLLFIFATPVQIYGSRHFYIHSFHGLKRGVINMDLLVVLTTTVSYVYSVIVLTCFMVTAQNYSPNTLFETTVLLFVLVTLTRWLIEIIKRRIMGVMTRMRNLQAKEALLVEQEEQDEIFSDQKIDARLIEKGDLLKVLPGRKVPSDGKVIAGSSTVDESPLTGDSKSLSKSEESSVIGGSINEQGILFVRATRVGSETVLTQILDSLRNAQLSKVRIQKKMEKVSRYFTISVCFLSLIIFAIWTLIGFTNIKVLKTIDKDKRRHIDLEVTFYYAFKIAISVLAASVPYVYSLVAPTTLMVGTGLAAANGIVIKGGSVIDNASKVTTIVFDKTGIITRGEPTITSIRLYVDETVLSIKAFLSIIGMAETCSNHPIAVAMRTYVRQVLGEAATGMCEEILSTPGQGIHCVVSGLHLDSLADDDNHREKSVDRPNEDYRVTRLADVTIVRKPTNKIIEAMDKANSFEVLIGNRDWMTKNGLVVTQEMNRRMEDCEVDGESAILVAINNSIVAIVTLRDDIKPETDQVVRNLTNMGLKVTLLTGDSKLTAASIAKQVKIKSFYASLSPYRKYEKIKELQDGGEVVMMIGDGNKDGAALKQADVGVAVSNGSDLRIGENADIILLKQRFGDVLTSIDLSRRVIKRIKINIILLTVYHVLVLPIASGLFIPIKFVLSPWMAMLASGICSITILTSSLLLKLYQKPSICHHGNSEKRKLRLDTDPGCRNPVYQSSEDLRLRASNDQSGGTIIAKTKL